MRNPFRSSRVPGWLAGALSLYLRFVMRTTRWTMVGAENLAPYLHDANVIVSFWHERLAVMPAFWQHWTAQVPAGSIRIYLLVSPHRDGQLIADILRPFGMDSIDGSSNRRAVAGLKAARDRLGPGTIVSIVPDGPRGPAFSTAPGVAALAALTGRPILPISAQTTRHRRAKTWDRMIVPFPFGRGTLVCGPAIHVPRQNPTQSLPSIAAAITAAAAAADHGCGL
ncbi:MAG: lysophospholipid acyltransferase family protein [Rhodospirillales bacterium]|nr:lysophospholipid acyltransferase family protein [Rhodospirillales bacterium]